MLFDIEHVYQAYFLIMDVGSRNRDYAVHVYVQKQHKTPC